MKLQKSHPFYWVAQPSTIEKAIEACDRRLCPETGRNIKDQHYKKRLQERLRTGEPDYEALDRRVNWKVFDDFQGEKSKGGTK